MDPVGEAARLHERALRELGLLERRYGSSSPRLVAVLNTLGGISEDLSDYEEAEAAYRRAAALLAERGSDEELRVRTIANLARMQRVRGRLDEAERLYLEAIGLAENVFDPNGPELPSLLNDLAVVYKYAARFDEAEALYRRALATIEATLGPAHPEAAAIWHNLGGIEHARGRHAEGEPYARRSVEIREAALGPDHPAVAADVAALAALVQGQGRLEEAETLYRRAMLGVNCSNLGALMAARGDDAEAEDLYGRALRIKEAVLGGDHPDVALTVHNLAVLRAGQDRVEEAETL